MISQQGMESVIYSEKAGGSYQHGVKHLAGGGSADKDTIPKKGGKTGLWNDKCPIKVGVGSSDY